jgi:hypothetical protein
MGSSRVNGQSLLVESARVCLAKAPSVRWLGIWITRTPRKEISTMSLRLRSMSCLSAEKVAGVLATRSKWSISVVADRAVQIALAVYLLPALVVVLLVGGVGMLILSGASFCPERLAEDSVID